MSVTSGRDGAPGAGDLVHLRVTVVGLGRFGGGVGVTRWLAARGARVTVSDAADPDTLAESVARLEGCDVALHLGGHEEADFLDADLLVVNPAVPKDHPLLARAEARGVRRTSEINLFLQRCAAPVLGVTGSVGKSTTSAMAAAILRRGRPTHLGGNIGGSLLASLERIESDHAVVLELSSFQLEDTPIVGISPRVAVVTNLTPNHLDRHGTMAEYAQAKKHIFRFQGPEDVLVLNAACEATRPWADEAPGHVEWFDATGAGFELAVPGAHNQANAAAAWAATRQFGATRCQADEALEGFAGLPHRLEVVAELAGVRYVNDSKCTTPAGAIVALEAFSERSAVMIVGGYDKGSAMDELGEALAGRAKAVVGIGATGGAILQAVEAHRRGDRPICVDAGTLGSAVVEARRHAGPGDAVVLSPACASYDQFDNYERRGEAFAALVGGLGNG